jgi:nucleotide-binding universal stress UspA family protein
MAQIIVGMDESEGAAHALRWAVGEGAGRDWKIRAVLAWSYLDQHQLEATGTFDPAYNEEVARKTLAAAVERAVGAEAAADVDQEVVCDLAARALIERSADADLLVVGARGLGGFKSLLLGSVSNQCLHHATCPIAIVRSDIDPVRHVTERIVVGIDGSPTAQRALRWALDLAGTGHAEVEVVHAWQPVVLGGPFAPVMVDTETWGDAARRTLDEALAAEDTTDVHVTRNLTCGGAANAILDAARGADGSDRADLVVVGSRGRGGFAGLLLGSVSHQVAHHAPCPVVVVPPDSERAAGG